METVLALIKAAKLGLRIKRMKPIKRIKTYFAVRKLIKENEEMFKGGLTYAAVVAFAAQLFAMIAGIDVASAEVDAIVAAITTAVGIYGRFRATRDLKKAE